MKANRNRRQAMCRALMGVVALVLVIGSVAQLTLLVRLSAQSKQISSVSRDVAELRAVKNNLEVALDQYHSLDRVEQLARQMGMVLPGSENIRVIYVDVNTEEAARAVQTASSGER